MSRLKADRKKYTQFEGENTQIARKKTNIKNLVWYVGNFRWKWQKTGAALEFWLEK